MQESILVVDRAGHTLEAKCTSFDWDQYCWQVQFWGPHGLRYSVHIHVNPGNTLEQSVQRYAQDHHLIAVVEAPKHLSFVPPAL